MPHPHPLPSSSSQPAHVPSAFPEGTDPSLIDCFKMVDRDGNGFVDDKELNAALSSNNHSFSLTTVHLLMNQFKNNDTKKIGPKEFIKVFYSLQNWRSIFEIFDKDRSGNIDASELNEALLSLGYSVSAGVLDLLVSKFAKSGGKNKAIEYDSFIDHYVEGLIGNLNENDASYNGWTSFTHEAFMLTLSSLLVAQFVICECL